MDTISTDKKPWPRRSLDKQCIRASARRTARTKTGLITLCYLHHDLLWRPLGQLVHFVWVSHPTRGNLVLLCTDLTRGALDSIRLYGWRFKIEVSFKQAIHTLGAYAYHFWMRDMTPFHRGSGKQSLQRKSPLYRQHLRRKLAAYKRHIQLGLIAQGLLQYLALTFRRATWLNFHSYIRTASPQKPPSEWVAAQALRHTWPQFLQSSSCSLILKKFLATKISHIRCGYTDVFALDQPHERFTVQSQGHHVLYRPACPLPTQHG